MLEQYAELIFKELSQLLPKEWNRVILYGLILEGSYELSFYVRKSNSAEYQNDFTLLDQKLFTEQELDNVYKNIYSLCLEAMEKMDGEVWKTFTIIVEANVHFSIDYGYDEEIISKRDEWKEKYLI